MTFFSRCEPSQAFDQGFRAPVRRRVRDGDATHQRAISGFLEDIGILFRYAAGLDYYGRGRLLPKD